MMKKKDLEKIFPNITEEQLKMISEIESDSYAKGKAESETAYREAEMSRLIDSGIKESGAKNQKAVAALLEMDKISYENGELKGFYEQLEQIKKDCDYMFEEDTKKPKFTAPEKSSKELSKKGFEALGYKKRLKLFLENPTLYRQLTQR